MSAQTSYEVTPAIGFRGMLAQNTNLKQIDSYLAEGVVNFGYAVKYGSDPDTQVEQITAQGDTVIGLAVYKDGQEQAADGTVQYADTQQLPVLHQGRLYVVAGDAVAKGASVFAGVTTEAGKFFSDDGGGTRATVPGATFQSTGAADGDIVIVELK